MGAVTREFLQELPKCEHHIHVEGSLSPSLLFKLAERNGVKLPADMPGFESEEALEHRYTQFSGLDDFLAYYYIGMSVLQSEQDFEDLAWQYFCKAHADGVAHAEVFFDPQAHIERGVDIHNVTAGFAKAVERAQAELGLSGHLIMCFLRHLPAASANETLLAAQETDCFKRNIIKGVGLDSSEVGNPPELFTEAFAEAARLGLRSTAHGGEEGDISYISGALDALGVERIDHGIRAQDSPELMKRLAEAGTLLSVCPLSNVRLRCVTSVAELPIREFLAAGITFSINSDDPAYFGGYILDNYIAIQDSFNLTHQEWETIASGSIRGSWVSDERKAELLDRLASVVRKHA